MMEKLKVGWAKFKWYIIAGLAVTAAVALFFWRDQPAAQKILKQTVKSQQKIVAKELERKKARLDANSEELKRVEGQIEEIDKKIEEIEEIDTLSLKELSDAWKTVSL